MSIRSDRIGKAIADALNSPPLDVNGGTLEQRKVRIWQAIAAALDPEWMPAWIHILVDPTAGAGVSRDPVTGDLLEVETLAWQENPFGLLPVAIWAKTGAAATAWSRIWPATSTTTNTTTIINNPATVASTLYPALKRDPNLRSSLCLYHLWFNGLGPGWNSTQWTQVDGVSTYQHNYNGVITGWLPGGDQVPLNAGVLVFIRYDNANYLIGDTEVAPSLGIYEVFDPGSATTPAIIRRAPGENLPGDIHHGMVVKVFLGQFSDASEFFTLTTSDPITIDTTPLAWTVSSSYSGSDAYELLTGPQLTSEGASSDLLEISATATAGDVVFTTSFETLVGIPALGTLPAGPWTKYVELLNLDAVGSPGSVTTLKVRIVDAATSAILFTMESPPINNVVPAPISFQYVDSGHTISPTDRLTEVFVLHTTSTTPVKMNILYSSDARLTRITVPFTLPISGASDGTHPSLSLRDAPRQHPSTSVQPAVDTATESSGWVTFAAKSDAARVALSTDNLQGLAVSPFDDLKEVTIYVTNASPSTIKHVIDGASVTGTQVPIRTQCNPDGSAASLTLKHPTLLCFLYDAVNGPCLRLKAAVNYGA